jgi:hypothetical protein
MAFGNVVGNFVCLFVGHIELLSRFGKKNLATLILKPRVKCGIIDPRRKKIATEFTFFSSCTFSQHSR